MSLTLKQIYSQMGNFVTASGQGRNLRDYAPVRVKGIEPIVWAGMNSVLYKAIMEGTDTEHITMIQLFNVEFSTEYRSGLIKVIDDHGTYYHEICNVADTPVALKCSCADFRHTWETPLFLAKSLVGSPRKYTRVPGSNRPPRNPKGVVGVCKHVHQLANSLRQSGILKG